MKTRRTLLLISLFCFGTELLAQTVVLQGQFLYSTEEEYSYGIYTHPLLEAEFPVLGEGRSDANGRFTISLEIAEPQILQIKRRADTYSIYVQPGDSLSLKILNRFNIEFAGSSRRENELFFQMEFHQAFYPADPLEDCLLAIDTLESNRQAQIQLYEGEEALINEDFLTYLKAAVAGSRYARLNQIYHHHMEEQPENPLLGIVSNDLLSLPAIDEVRSAAYLNAVVALMENSLDKDMAVDPILKENEALQWEQRRKILAATTEGTTALKRHMDFFLLGMQLWWVEDEEELAGLDQFWSEIREEYPADPLDKLLVEMYQERRSSALLKKMGDINLLDSLGQSIQLSDFQQFPLLVLLWSDSMSFARDFEQLTSLLPPQWKEEQLVTLYFGEEDSIWLPTIVGLDGQEKGVHFKMNPEERKTFKEKYMIPKAPVYLLFESHNSLQQVSFELSQRIYRALFSLGRFR